MKRWRLFWGVVKRTSADKTVYAFIANFFLVAFLITLVEPGIAGYGDGLWYTFVSATTIGFGDLVVTTLPGRLLTAYIAVTEILMVAVISGVVVSYYLEVVHRREQKTISALLAKLEHLEDLSPDELRALSQEIREKTWEDEL